MAKALAALSLASVIVAQSAQPTFRARVDLVQVDVVVVDQAGNPVRGIKQSDFALFDRRKPQDIATFDEVSPENAADAALPALPATVKRDVAGNQSA